jgi:large subunit ribosomal protein L17
MRHRAVGRKFGIPSDQRRALLKGLVRALFIYQRIQTTETRAKDVRKIAERLITRAKTADTLHSRREANKTLTDETLVRHLFTKIAPEFKDRPGGYTRLTKIGMRRGDAAPIVMLELATDTVLGMPVVPDKIGTARPYVEETA